MGVREEMMEMIREQKKLNAEFSHTVKELQMYINRLQQLEAKGLAEAGEIPTTLIEGFTLNQQAKAKVENGTMTSNDKIRLNTVQTAKQLVDLWTNTPCESMNFINGAYAELSYSPQTMQIEFYEFGNEVDCQISFKHNNDVIATGEAFCHEDDVYNFHIGCALALGRALMKDIPSVISSPVQPDTIRIGQRVKIISGMCVGTTGKVLEIDSFMSDGKQVKTATIKVTGRIDETLRCLVTTLKITDDTDVAL